MDSIAHVRLRFLPLTETFIYGEVTGIMAYRVIVLCAERQNADRFPYDNVRCTGDRGIVQHLVNGAYLKFGWGCPYFSKVVEEENVKLIHAHYGPTGVRMLPLKRKHRLPLITSFRGIDASLFPSRSPGMYDRLFREGDLFLARSEDMRKDLVGMGCKDEKVVVHHSGIDLDEFKYAPRKEADETVFLTVARLTENKGVQYAIEAFAKTRETHPHTKLKVIGDGPYKCALERKASELGVKDRVEFTGALPHENVLEEMLKAHAFVLASYTTDEGEKEGVPNVLMEAQATGMPVVSTKHAGIPELVLDGRSGILVGERDSEGLGDAMTGLLENPGRWAKMGSEGRRHVEAEFNIKTQAKKLEAIYSRYAGG